MSTQFPQGRTAIMVIHGIGEQNPLETLDSFSRGLINLFTARSIPFTASHKIAERKGSGGTPWIESYVRLQATSETNLIDIHECYWAHITEEKISVPEVWCWVEKTLEGTRKFYDENIELRSKYEKGGRLNFKLTKVLILLYILSILYPLLKIVIPVLLYFFRFPFISGFKKSAARLEKVLRPAIVGYIGDVAIYTTTDAKSRYFENRQKILAESETLFETLLNDPTYDKIIIAGHSLGSVVAYDTLNRINLKANLTETPPPTMKKIGGLITFGSPLDKIAFFFREHTTKSECIRRQIMQFLHSFKSKQLDGSKNSVLLAGSVKPLLDDVTWINYYDNLDPVSGHLDFYNVTKNELYDMGVKWGVAHTAYWEYQPMYADIKDNFLQ